MQLNSPPEMDKLRYSQIKLREFVTSRTALKKEILRKLQATDSNLNPHK